MGDGRATCLQFGDWIFKIVSSVGRLRAYRFHPRVCSFECRCIKIVPLALLCPMPIGRTCCKIVTTYQPNVSIQFTSQDVSVTGFDVSTHEKVQHIIQVFHCTIRLPSLESDNCKPSTVWRPKNNVRRKLEVLLTYAWENIWEISCGKSDRYADSTLPCFNCRNEGEAAGEV